LDLDPRTEKKRFDNEALRKVITDHPKLVKKKYKFQYYDKEIYPVVMAMFFPLSRDVYKSMVKSVPGAKESCPLSALVLRASLEDFKETLEKNPEDVNNIFCDSTFLHIACTYYADIEVLKCLSKNIDPKCFRAKDKSGLTPLAIACKINRELEFIKLLVEYDPKAVEELSIKGASPLHHAVRSTNTSLETVKYLKELWSDALEICDEDGDSPLHDAVHFCASEEIIHHLAEECPEMLLQVNKADKVPYLLEKDKGRKANSAIFSYLGVASFYRKMQEEDERSPLFKISELIPLICDVHVMRLFYTYVNTSWRLSLLQDIDRKRFMKEGLIEAAKTTGCTKSVATFKLIIKKAESDGLIDEMQRFELDREAEVFHTSKSHFVQDMWAHINTNTARIDRLELAVDNLNDNVRNLHSAVNKLRDGMVQRRKIENTMFLMNVVLSVFAMGAVGEQFTKFMGQAVDFGCLEELKAHFPEDSAAIDNAAYTSGDVQVKDIFSNFVDIDSSAEKSLTNDAVWGGCLFSLAFAAGITNRKALKEVIKTDNLNFEIPQVEVPKLSSKSISQRLTRIELDMGVASEDGCSLLVRVKYLEKQVLGNNYEPDVPNILDRVATLELYLYKEIASKPTENYFTEECGLSPQKVNDAGKGPDVYTDKINKKLENHKQQQEISKEANEKQKQMFQISISTEEKKRPSLERPSTEGSEVVDNGHKTKNSSTNIESVFQELEKLEFKNEDTFRSLGADTIEEENIFCAIKESEMMQVKRGKVVDHALNNSGGLIIPTNHEETFDVNDEALAILMEMGFDVARAITVLKKCNNNIEEAMNFEESMNES